MGLDGEGANEGVSGAGARGATLIELVLVLVILAIIGAIALPQMQALAGLKAEGGARKVMHDLHYAQVVAMQQNRTVGVMIEPANDRYRVFYVSSGINVDDPVSGAPGAAEADWTSGLVTDFTTHPELKGVDLVSVSANIAAGMRFDSMGRPRDSAGTVLAADAPVLVSCAGYSRTLQIEKETGRIIFQ